MAFANDAPQNTGRSPGLAACHELPRVVLTIGEHQATALLFDESRDGLAVLLPEEPSFWVDETGELSTDAATISVRVTTIVRFDADESIESEAPQAFRIGLERIENDSFAPAVTDPQENHKTVSTPPAALAPLISPKSKSSGIIAALIVCLPLLAVGAVWYNNYRQNHSTSHTLNLPADEGASSSTTAAPAVPPQPVLAEPTPEMFGRLGVEPFVLPEVAAKLQLSPSQEGTYESLQQATNAALADLDKYWQSVGRLEQARRRNLILEAAREQALAVLSATQRAQWDALVRTRH